jgi:hypothetical protein
LVGRSTCSDGALRPNKRMNASRNRPTGSLRSVTFTAGRVIGDVGRRTEPLVRIWYDKSTVFGLDSSAREQGLHYL